MSAAAGGRAGSAPGDAPAADRTVTSATCLGCGCACDDIVVAVTANRIAEARHACAIGNAWFGDGCVPALAAVHGRAAAVDEALDAAASLLDGATRPLVYLAPDLSCEAQREGVAVADMLHAALDSITSVTAMASILAAQEHGRAGATLGEVRNRGDVIVFWGVDPAVRYPRYRERYAPETPGTHVGGGRSARTIVAVDVGAAPGPADADVRVAVAAGDEVAVLTALRALVVRSGNGMLGVGRDGGSWQLARYLAPLLTGARYLVIVHDAEPALDGDRGGERASGPLIALAQALNGVTRCALSTLRGGGNRSGADAVLTSQTGYPAAVDFARGYPRYLPHDGSAGARLARGAVDAALVIGDAARLPAAIAAGLVGVPCAVIGPRASESAFAAAGIVVDTGVAGIHDGGTAFRTDDVPLPLRPSVLGPPVTADVVFHLGVRLARGRAIVRQSARRASDPPAATRQGELSPPAAARR